MALSLASLRKVKLTAAPFVVVYGVPGVGKTSLAAEAPETVWLQFQGENPPKDVELNGWSDVDSYDDVVAALGELINQAHDFKTLVIDSTTGLERVIQREACKRNGWPDIEAPGYGKGYVAAENVWVELLEGLAALRRERNMGVTLLGHCEVDLFKSPITDPYSRYQLAVHKRALALIESQADAIFFVNYRVTLKKVDQGFNKSATHAEGGGARVIYAEERGGFKAKNRYGIPAETNYKKGEGWSALAKHFPPAE